MRTQSLRTALCSVLWLTMSCAPPASHRYPSSAIPSQELVGSWRAELRGKGFWDDSGTELTLTGNATLTLEEDGEFVYQFVPEADGKLVATRGRWSLCREHVGGTEQLQCVCLDSLALKPDGTAGIAKATRIPFLVIEGGSQKPPTGTDLSLCDPDEDRMLCFTRRPEYKRTP